MVQIYCNIVLAHEQQHSTWIALRFLQVTTIEFYSQATRKWVLEESRQKYSRGISYVDRFGEPLYSWFYLLRLRISNWLTINQMVITGVVWAQHSNKPFLTSLSSNISSNTQLLFVVLMIVATTQVLVVLTHFGSCQLLPYTYFKSLSSTDCSVRRTS